MSNAAVRVIDTNAFHDVMSMREELLKEYDQINTDFDTIRDTLLSNWKGKGADEFKMDAVNVKRNIGGINVVLKTMSDTLLDCLDEIKNTDNESGDVCRQPPCEEG
jgi:uncharacterized protein YukE